MDKDPFAQRAAVYDNLHWVRDAQLIQAISTLVGDLAQPPGRALDLACGSGALLPVLQGLGFEVTGLDQSEAMLDRARRNCPHLYTLLEGQAENLPFGDCSFQVVVCRNGLHHFLDPPKALEQVWRVLRDRGALVMAESVSPSLRAKPIWKNALLLKDKGRNMQYTFAYSELLTFLEESGFCILKAMLIRQRFSVRNWLLGGGVPPSTAEVISGLFNDADPIFQEEMRMERAEDGDILLDRSWGLLGLRKLLNSKHADHPCRAPM